jgi:hypothetical protein
MLRDTRRSVAVKILGKIGIREYDVLVSTLDI